MIDVELEKIKIYVRLSRDLGFLPMKKYEYWSGLLAEIGKDAWRMDKIRKK